MTQRSKLSQAQIQAMLKQHNRKTPVKARAPLPAMRLLEVVAGIALVAGAVIWYAQRDKKVQGMQAISAGCFTMGASSTEIDALHSEKPTHKVCLNAFQIDITEVTQQNFQQIMGNNPSHNTGCLTCPVEMVTWNEAFTYCQKVGKRLPTEAEWEFAVRAGSQTPYFWGTDFDPEYSWNQFNSDGTTQPVRTNLPNEWRLYDMNGNVWEWVADWADNTYYQSSPQKQPTGPSTGTSRVVRGGSYNAPPRFLRSATRGWAEPQERLNYVGFRCAK